MLTHWFSCLVWWLVLFDFMCILTTCLHNQDVPGPVSSIAIRDVWAFLRFTGFIKQVCIEFLIQNGILLHFLSHLSYQYEVLVTNGSEKTFLYLGEVIDVIESMMSNSAQRWSRLLSFVYSQSSCNIYITLRSTGLLLPVHQEFPSSLPYFWSQLSIYSIVIAL